MSNRFSLRKSKRVKWFPDSKLCQVKLFSPEDSPSKVGSKTEDHLQAKPSRMFKDPAHQFRKGLSGTLKRACVPNTVWKCPPMFILNNDWQVVAGELSEETETQKRREMRELEAVYPRPSDIPPSPSVSPCLEEAEYDDHETPIISVVPIEEEDTVAHESTLCYVPECFNSVALNQAEIGQNLAQHNAPKESNVINEKIVEISTGLDADVVTAASTAFTAIMKSNEKGSLIDTDLLIKILRDPKMIETLLKQPGVSGLAKPAVSSVPISINDSCSMMFKKPFSKSSNVNNIVQQNLPSASNAFLSSNGAQVLTLPLSNAKSQAKENSRVCGKDLQFSSNTSFSESTATTSSNLLDLTNLLQVRSALKPTPLASISDQEPPMALSSMPGHLSMNYGPNMMSKTMKQNPALPREIPSARSTLQYSSPTSDGLETSHASSVKTKVVKDLNYYKNLIKLHGTEGQVSQEGHAQQYRSRTSEMTAVSGQGGARAKKEVQCRFFNSSKGCRNGLSCPFQHESSLKLQAESKANGYGSKRIKLSRELC